MGGDLKSFAARLLASPDEESTFAGLVDRNGAGVLQWMQQKGYITPTQYRSAFDSRGNLTDEAKNDLKGIMYRSIFQNGNTHLEEMFNTLPAKAQRAILATAYRDYDSPNTERMNAELQASVSAYHALSQLPEFANAKNYREARMAAAWKRQYALDDVTGGSYLPSERYSNFAVLLVTMYRGQSQAFIQNTFRSIYDLVQGTQEATLFEEPDNTPRTLVDAVNEAVNARGDELLLNGKFEYDGQRRSDVLGGRDAAGQQGRQGSTGSSQAGERTEEGTGTNDGIDGTANETDSGRSGRNGGENKVGEEKEKSSQERLTKEEAAEIIADMEEHAEVAPEMELTIENWDILFGEDGRVNTPIGEVKMGENQFTKLMRQGRNGKLGMVKPTLENPYIIIEDESEAKEGDTTERGSSYVYVKTFIKPDGTRYYYFTSVTVSKDGREVVVSNQEKRRNVLTNLLLKGKLVWKHADDVSTVSDVTDGLYSSQGNVSDPTTEGTVAPQTNNIPEPTLQTAAFQPHGGSSSENKDTEKSRIDNKLGGKVSSADENPSVGTDFDAVIDMAREGDEAARASLREYGLDWGKKGVYRFASEGEVRDILSGGRYDGRFGNGRVDVTNSDTPTTAASAEYRITFRDGFDFNKNGTEEARRTVMKNAELGDGYVTGGYSLEDVERIERRNGDGNYETVYEAKGSASVSEAQPAVSQEVGTNALPNENNIAPLQGNQNSDENGTVSESVPQGEHRTEAPQNSRMEEAAAELRKRIEAAAGDAQASGRTLSERQQEELEQRAAESYAKERGVWIPMSDTFAWLPMPSGNENNEVI